MRAGLQSSLRGVNREKEKQCLAREEDGEDHPGLPRPVCFRQIARELWQAMVLALGEQNEIRQQENEKNQRVEGRDYNPPFAMNPLSPRDDQSVYHRKTIGRHPN